MADLHLVGGKVVGMGAQLGGPGLKGVPGPGGLLKEHHEQSLVLEEAMGFAQGKAALEILGHVQDHVQLFPAPILGGDEVFASKQ